MPFKNRVFSAPRLIAAATSGSRAQMTTSLPLRRTTHASAVPYAPAPMIPIRVIVAPHCHAFTRQPGVKAAVGMVGTPRSHAD